LKPGCRGLIRVFPDYLNGHSSTSLSCAATGNEIPEINKIAICTMIAVKSGVFFLFIMSTVIEIKDISDLPIIRLSGFANPKA